MTTMTYPLASTSPDNQKFRTYNSKHFPHLDDEQRDAPTAPDAAAAPVAAAAAAAAPATAPATRWGKCLLF